MVAWQQGVARYCSQYHSLLWRWQSGSFPILVCFFLCLQALNACIYCTCSEMDICMNLVVKLSAVTIKRVCFFITVSVFTLTVPFYRGFHWLTINMKCYECMSSWRSSMPIDFKSRLIVQPAFWFGLDELLMDKQIKWLVIFYQIQHSHLGFFTFPPGMKTRSESKEEIERRNTLYDWQQSTCHFLRVFLQLRHFSFFQKSQ